MLRPRCHDENDKNPGTLIVKRYSHDENPI